MLQTAFAQPCTVADGQCTLWGTCHCLFRVQYLAAPACQFRCSPPSPGTNPVLHPPAVCPPPLPPQDFEAKLQGEEAKQQKQQQQSQQQQQQSRQAGRDQQQQEQGEGEESQEGGGDEDEQPQEAEMQQQSQQQSEGQGKEGQEQVRCAALRCALLSHLPWAAPYCTCWRAAGGTQACNAQLQ